MPRHLFYTGDCPSLQTTSQGLPMRRIYIINPTLKILLTLILLSSLAYIKHFKLKRNLKSRCHEPSWKTGKRVHGIVFQDLLLAMVLLQKPKFWRNWYKFKAERCLDYYLDRNKVVRELQTPTSFLTQSVTFVETFSEFLNKFSWVKMCFMWGTANPWSYL